MVYVLFHQRYLLDSRLSIATAWQISFHAGPNKQSLSCLFFFFFFNEDALHPSDLIFPKKKLSVRLVAALIISRLDYCNSVLAGLPAEQIGRPQRVQKSAARLVLKKRKWHHITALLNELHWLPVKFRCEYKIATHASFSLHVSDFTHTPIIERKTLENS